MLQGTEFPAIISSPQQMPVFSAHLAPASTAFPGALVSAAREIRLDAGSYAVRLAVTEGERKAAFRLRFVVFNLELNEGLESAYSDGYDTDRYDAVCDHLIVENKDTGEIVGTYRLQMGVVAATYFGYYSEQEFDFSPFESIRGEIVELGRACIHRDHRSTEVLHLLWRGIARYVTANGGRYMMGCCSLTSQDAAMGWTTYDALKNYMVEPALRTAPKGAFKFDRPAEVLPDVRPPKLLRAYLTLGAKICGEPAIDREFKTIDFLTLCDLRGLNPRMAARFLEGC